MKKALIVTEDYFPYGSATASRILAFCRLFIDVGYDIYVLSLHGHGSLNHNQIEYDIISGSDKTSIETFIGDNRIIDRLRKYLNNNTVDFIFGVSIHVKYNKILKLCKDRKIPLILEQCEWYDVSSYKLGKIDYRYLRFTNNIKHNYGKANGIIVISKFLEKHFSIQNKNVIRIPSITDVMDKKCNVNNKHEKIRIVFAGSVSKSKELLKPILEALISSKEFLSKIQFNIYGINEHQLLLNIDNDKELLNKVRNSITINGFIPQTQIEDKLKESDYSIFIRQKRRSSNAGFPTKLCESMSIGTPVITNDTGDIITYIRDGINGFICKDNTKESIIEVFDRILRLNNDEYAQIRDNARKTAEEHFDYRNYKKQILSFIDNVLNNSTNNH